MKAKVNLSLHSISIPEKIQNERIYANNLDAYPLDFPNPHPVSSVLRASATDLETAYGVAQNPNATASDIAAMHAKERTSDAQVTELSHYAEDLPTCTPELIEKLGMVVRLSGGAHPYVFTIKQGANPGEAILHCKTVEGAAYEFQFFKGINFPADGATGDQAWQPLGISARKATFFVTGLQMEVKYWFRVRPIIEQTNEAWEAPISIILV